MAALLNTKPKNTTLIKIIPYLKDGDFLVIIGL